MSDVRAALTEALREHQWSFIKHGCRCDDPATVTEWPEHAADAIAKALEAAPGVAVIQLPEPSYVDEPAAGIKGVGFNGGPQDTHLSERGVYAHDGMVYDQWDGVTPADALKVAGWWAAAAVVSEGER